MAIRTFTYPLKGNNDPASLRTKEQALEAFLNSLDLSDNPDDPSHDHDSSYAAIGHSHPSESHQHDQYVESSEGVTAPLDPETGDIWVETEAGVVTEVWVWTVQGWLGLLGGGSGGAGGPHSRHPNAIVLFEGTSNVDKWRIGYNPELASLDFTWIG